MNCCTNSFPPRIALVCLTLLTGVLALAAIDTRAQTRRGTDVYQKISLKATPPCVVGTSGEVTALIKNGVELSVSEDWDCDGIADAYDNCVGMPDRAQIDSDGNGIGDVCEAATTVRTSEPINRRPIVKAETRKAKAVDKRSRSAARTRRSRADHTKQREAKVRSRKPTTKRKTKT